MLVPRPFTQLTDLADIFNPYYIMWTTGSDFRSHHSTWLFQNFNLLPVEDILYKLDSWLHSMKQIEKTMAGKQQHRAIAQHILKSITDFQTFIPLLTSLRKPFLKDRHWSQLEYLLNNIPVKEITLQKMIDIKLYLHMHEISQVVFAAEQEYSMETELDEVVRIVITFNMFPGY